MVDNFKGKGHKGLGNSSESNLRHLQLNQVIIGTGGALRDERRCENLELELEKPLTRKRREIRVQSKGTEKKMLIPPSFRDVGR